MTDNDDQLYVVVCEIGPTCLKFGHKVEALPDHVLCLDCSAVARQAAIDGLDIDQVLTEFRAWTPPSEGQP